MIFCADIHLGNHRLHGGPVVAGLNERHRLTLDVVRHAFMAAEGWEDCGPGVAILGDVFDDVKPLPQSIARMQDILNLHHGWSWILKGNHDNVSEQLGDHALGPLRSVSDVLATPTIQVADCTTLCLPFIAEQAEMWVPTTVRTLLTEDLKFNSFDRGPIVLLLHCGIHDAETRKAASWDMASAHDAISVETLVELCREHGIKRVFAGNWHSYRHWSFDGGDIQICQVGALVPTGWDNPGLDGYGGLVGMNADLQILRHEIAGPRFVNVHSHEDLTAVLLDLEDRKRSSHFGEFSLFVRWHAPREEREQAIARLQALKDDGFVHAFEVPPHTATAREMVRSAAKTLRSDVTLATALNTVASTAPMPAGVSRDRVVGLARRFLRVTS